MKIWHLQSLGPLDQLNKPFWTHNAFSRKLSFRSIPSICIPIFLIWAIVPEPFPLSATLFPTPTSSFKKKKPVCCFSTSVCFSYQSDSLELSNKKLKVDFWGVRTSFASISYVGCYFIAEIFGSAGENWHSTGLNLTGIWNMSFHFPAIQNLFYFLFVK